MHKKDAQNVIQNTLNFMENPNRINNVINAKNALRLLSGKNVLISATESSTGLSYGSKKAIAFDNWAVFQATASLSLNKSRIIG